jgi:ABC-type xylose transport system permease subunit
MSTDPILVLSLCGMIMALIAVRLTFRYSPNPRAALFSPTVFAACGELIGISSGMIWWSDKTGRVDIDKGMTVVACGGFLGAMIGAIAMIHYPSMKQGKTTVFLLMMMFLGGCIGAPIGWLAGHEPVAGDFETNADFELATARLTSSRMIWGTAIGSGIGLLVGLSEVLFRRRGVT